MWCPSVYFHIWTLCHVVTWQFPHKFPRSIGCKTSGKKELTAHIFPLSVLRLRIHSQKRSVMHLKNLYLSSCCLISVCDMGVFQHWNIGLLMSSEILKAVVSDEYCPMLGSLTSRCNHFHIWQLLRADVCISKLTCCGIFFISIWRSLKQYFRAVV